jgi:hypothetical protein
MRGKQVWRCCCFLAPPKHHTTIKWDGRACGHEVLAGARWFCQQKKQQSKEVGKRKTAGTMGWRRPGGNVLSVAVAARITASPTM